MAGPIARTTSSTLCTIGLLLVCCAAAGPPALAQDPPPPDPAAGCTVDLACTGTMKDIVSNALIRGLARPEVSVARFLTDAETRFASGPDLLRAAARHFDLEEAVLAGEVERFRHCNCEHGPFAAHAPGRRDGRGDAMELSSFAKDVVLHVVLHELGHALVREFDLPVLGNEETMADAFATHYLTTHMPERALDVLRARTTSLMIEAREVPRERWTVHGEHDNDARRAFQIAALAVAADPDRYAPLAEVVGMSERDAKKARDYGTEIHRSWRRMLAPLWMPDGARSNEVRVVLDASDGVLEQLEAAGFAAGLESVLARFDWHSQVTLRFAAGDGGAAWSRSGRTITVAGDYLRRFVEQGRTVGY